MAKATPYRAVPSTIVSQSLGTIHPRRAASPVTKDRKRTPRKTDRMAGDRMTLNPTPPPSTTAKPPSPRSAWNDKKAPRDACASGRVSEHTRLPMQLRRLVKIFGVFDACGERVGEPLTRTSCRRPRLFLGGTSGCLFQGVPSFLHPRSVTDMCALNLWRTNDSETKKATLLQCREKPVRAKASSRLQRDIQRTNTSSR